MYICDFNSILSHSYYCSNPRSIVLDNASIHHTQLTIDLIEETGALTADTVVV